MGVAGVPTNPAAAHTRGPPHWRGEDASGAPSSVVIRSISEAAPEINPVLYEKHLWPASWLWD